MSKWNSICTQASFSSVFPMSINGKPFTQLLRRKLGFPLALTPTFNPSASSVHSLSLHLCCRHTSPYYHHLLPRLLQCCLTALHFPTCPAHPKFIIHIVAQIIFKNCKSDHVTQSLPKTLQRFSPTALRMKSKHPWLRRPLPMLPASSLATSCLAHHAPQHPGILYIRAQTSHCPRAFAQAIFCMAGSFLTLKPNVTSSERPSPTTHYKVATLPHSGTLSITWLHPTSS